MDFLHAQTVNLLQITIQLKTKLFHFNVVLGDVKDQQPNNDKLQTVRNWIAVVCILHSVSINLFPD